MIMTETEINCRYYLDDVLKNSEGTSYSASICHYLNEKFSLN